MLVGVWFGIDQVYAMVQALGDQAAAAAGLEEAMRALQAASGSIVPGSAEAAKQARLQQFLEAKIRVA